MPLASAVEPSSSLALDGPRGLRRLPAGTRSVLSRSELWWMDAPAPSTSWGLRVTLCEAGSLAGLCCPHAQSEPQKEGQRRDLSPCSLAHGLCQASPGPGDVCLQCTRVVYGTLLVCLGSERPACGLSTEQSHLPEEVGRSLPRASPGLFASPPPHIPAFQGAWLPTSHLPTQPPSVGTCLSRSQPRVGALSTPESFP